MPVVDRRLLKFQRLMIKMMMKFGEIAIFRTHLGVCGDATKCDCFNPRLNVFDPMCPNCLGTGDPNADGESTEAVPEFKDTRVITVVVSPDDERFKEFSGGRMREYKKSALFAYEPTITFVNGYLGWLRKQPTFISRVTGQTYNLIWCATMPQDEVISLQEGQRTFQLEKVKVFDIEGATIAKYQQALVNRSVSSVEEFLATGKDGTLTLDTSDSERKTLVIDPSIDVEEGNYLVRHWVPYNETSVYKPNLLDCWVGYNVKLDEYFYLESMHEVSEPGEHYVVKTRNNVEGGVYEAGYWAGLEITTRYPGIQPPAG